MTASRERITYARVCVEVNYDTELIREFEIEVEDESTGEIISISIEVQYQWIPSRCSKCNLFGHNCNKPVAKVTPHVAKKGTSKKTFDKSKREEQWVEMVEKKGGKNSTPIENVETVVATLGQRKNRDVDMGYTKQILVSASKEIETSNSFKVLEEVQIGPYALEEESDHDEVMPSEDEHDAMPKIKAVSHHNRENKKKAKKKKTKGPKGGCW